VIRYLAAPPPIVPRPRARTRQLNTGGSAP
jgi:hypothetical protein